ncbi:MAG: hypothetical protein LC747_08245 [Acidobacteria bacterium]|nr:hypothetical protein [Acidobacteriota bacterium]
MQPTGQTSGAMGGATATGTLASGNAVGLDDVDKAVVASAIAAEMANTNGVMTPAS